MKVLSAIIIPPHLSVSGGVNAGLALSRAVARYCDMDVALMSREESEEALGAARLLRRRSSNPLAFTASFLPNRYRTMFYRSDIPALVACGGYDLVHLYNAVPTFEMERIARACLRRRVPYVVTTHGFVEFGSGGRGYGIRGPRRAVWRWGIERPLGHVVRNARMVFATSPVDVEIAATFGADRDRIVLVTNGVDPYYLDPPGEGEIAAMRTRLDLPEKTGPETPVCFFLGNHTRNKGVHVLLEAFTLTRRPYLLVAGGERRDYVPYERFASRCRAGQRMVFPGSLSRAEIRALYRYADLFVFPTLADTLPLVVLEAMASGLAVLSTRVGGVPFQVDDSCGRLVEPGDPRALKDAFESLAADPARLRAMGAAGPAIVRARFDWERSAREAFAHYRKIVPPA